MKQEASIKNSETKQNLNEMTFYESKKFRVTRIKKIST